MAQTEQIRDNEHEYAAAVSKCHQLLWLIDRIEIHHQPLLDALDAAIHVAECELPLDAKSKSYLSAKAGD